MGQTATLATTDDESPRDDTDPEQSAPAERRSDGSTERRRDLPKDVVFGLLSAERRRRVLRLLDLNRGEATIGDLAEHIAAEENDIDVAQLSSAQRKRVYVGLYQCHLPKMDDADVIDFDQARGTVELAECAGQLFPHLYLDSTEEAGANEETEDSGVLGGPGRLGALASTLRDRVSR